MQCWAVQKFLPLYVGDDDLPLLTTTISKHLENCPACCQVYQKFKASQKALQQLQHIQLPPSCSQIPWQAIQQKISDTTTQYPTVDFLYPFQLKVWIQVGAAAVLVIACLLWFWQDLVKSKPDLPATVFISKSSPTDHSSHSPANSMLPGAAREATVNASMFLNLPMYELNEVLPLSKQDASF